MGVFNTLRGAVEEALAYDGRRFKFSRDTDGFMRIAQKHPNRDWATWSAKFSSLNKNDDAAIEEMLSDISSVIYEADSVIIREATFEDDLLVAIDGRTLEEELKSDWDDGTTIDDLRKMYLD